MMPNKPVSQMTEEEFKRYMHDNALSLFLKLGPDKVHELYKVATQKDKMNKDRLKFRVFYGGDYSITPYCTIDMNGKVWLDTSIMRGDGLGDFDTDIIDITDKCTVEQCSGLRDINGNLIYEGDIVRFIGIQGSPEVDPEVVVWEYGCFCPGVDGPFENSTELYEIIGNIHEKKEQK